MTTVRPMPEIVRDLGNVRLRHTAALDAVASGRSCEADRDDLAIADEELTRFEDLCTGRLRHHLMSSGPRWGDLLSHPASPEIRAQVRLADKVEIDGVSMGIDAATRLVANAAGRGVAIADWTCHGMRLGAALDLEHPARMPEEPSPETPPETPPTSDATARAMPQHPAQGLLL